MKELIDFLEKNGFTEQANSFKNGGTSLDLNWRFTGNQGAMVIGLAYALKTNSSITSLNLHGNQIGVEEARTLADALKTNSSITSLDLVQNQIGYAGARWLADALKINTALTQLNLSGNQIGVEGARWLAEVLKTNSSITSLALVHNEIGAEEAKEIEGYIQRNENLAEKKAEALNTQGDSFCGKGEYDKAIEKYNEAIKISKKDSYIANKEKAEKEYKEQQQTAAKEFEQLILAIKENKTEEAEKLVKKIDVHILNKVTTNGDTALTLAADRGLEKVCEMLISKMSDQAINQVTNNGETALACAAWTSLEKICELLIPKMTEQAINVVTKAGNTALTFAAGKGLEKVCGLLIPKMTDQAINHIDKYGNTALIWATSRGLDKVCEILIPKMTDRAINHVNNNGDTSLTVATKNGLKNICDLLKLKTNEQNNQINKTNVEKNLAEDVFEKIADEINLKIANNATINAKDKTIMEGTIKDISQKTKLLISKNDKDQIINSMQNLIVDKPTKLQLAVIEDQIDKLIEQQNINHNKLAEKINIFQELVNTVNTNIANNATINSKDKSIIEKTIKDITDKIKVLHNTTDIEKITNSLQKLLTDKLVKSKLMAIDEQLDEIIEQQTKPDGNIIVNIVKEIIYDNPLLNHPELLQPAMEKFSLKEIGERINELSPSLINTAINSEDGELIILGGLMSLGEC